MRLAAGTDDDGGVKQRATTDAVTALSPDG